MELEPLLEACRQHGLPVKEETSAFPARRQFVLSPDLPTLYYEDTRNKRGRYLLDHYRMHPGLVHEVIELAVPALKALRPGMGLEAFSPNHATWADRENDWQLYARRPLKTYQVSHGAVTSTIRQRHAGVLIPMLSSPAFGHWDAMTKAWLAKCPVLHDDALIEEPGFIELSEPSPTTWLQLRFKGDATSPVLLNAQNPESMETPNAPLRPATLRKLITIQKRLAQFVTNAPMPTYADACQEVARQFQTRPPEEGLITEGLDLL